MWGSYLIPKRTRKYLQRCFPLLHPNAVVISLAANMAYVPTSVLCVFEVIDQAGSCKSAVDRFIPCADESKACVGVFIAVTSRTFPKQFHFLNHSDLFFHLEFPLSAALLLHYKCC